MNAIFLKIAPIFFSTSLVFSVDPLLENDIFEEGNDYVAEEDYQDYFFNSQYEYAISQNTTANQPNQKTAHEQERIFHYRIPMQQHDWNAWVEFLCWKTNESELDFVYTDSVNQGATEGVGSLASARFDWQPGVRIGASFNFSPDYFDLIFQYLDYRPSGSKSETRHGLSDNILIGTFVEHTGNSIGKAKSHIDLCWQQGDILLAKRFHPSKQTLATFFCGTTIGYLDQTWKINNYPFQVPPGGTFNPIRENWRFIGAGGKAGIDFDFYFGTGFSLNLKAFGSLVYGHYKNHFSNKLNTEIRANTKLNDHRIANNWQFFIGPEWGYMFKHWGLQLAAGYELNIWYNLHEVLRSLEDTGGNARPSTHSNSPISIQGFTGSVKANF